VRHGAWYAVIDPMTDDPLTPFDSAIFRTRVQDKRNPSSHMETEWGYAFSCSSPGHCGFDFF